MGMSDDDEIFPKSPWDPDYDVPSDQRDEITWPQVLSVLCVVAVVALIATC